MTTPPNPTPSPAAAPAPAGPDPGVGCGASAEQDISDAPYYGTTINGAGFALGPDGGPPVGRAPVINVAAGDTYRLRVINGAASWGYQVSVDGHEVEVAAVDGYPTRRARTPAVVLSAGETADLILTADAAPANYWVRALTASGFGAVAVLHYAGAPDPRNDTALGAPPVAEGCSSLRPGGLDLKLAPTLRGAAPADGGMGAPPPAANRTLALYMTLNSSPAMRAKPANLSIVGFDRPTPPPGCPPRPGGGPSSYCWGINWVIFGEDEGAGPVLERGARWRGAAATAPREYAIDATPGEVIDLVFINPSIMVHPMHPHGAGGWLLGTGVGAAPLSADGQSVNTSALAAAAPPAADGRAGTASALNLVDPPFRNVVPVPNAVPGVGDGWAVLRFRVPGAGAYAMHCHIDLHQEVGMVLYFAIRDAGAKDGGWRTPADMDCRRAARGRVDRGGGVDVRPFDAY
jgi:FtsP/CotA-like multicopper oxidase with cupredoxin domain